MTTAQTRFSTAIVISLAVTIFISVIVPRSLGFIPGLIGLVAMALWPIMKMGSAPLSLNTIRPILVACGAIIFLAGLSALWAIDSGGAIERTGKIAGVFLGGVLLFATAQALPVESLRRYWWSLPLAVTLTGIFLVVEYHFHYPIYRLIRGIEPDAKVRLSQLNRSSVALCMVSLPTIALLYSGLLAKGWSKIKSLAPCLGMVAIMLCVVALTDSQSAQLAFFLGLLTLAVAPVKRRAMWVAVMVGLCLGFLSAPWLAQYLFSLAPHDATKVNRYDLIVQSTNYLPRLEIWDFVSRYILQKPLTGYGIEATRHIHDFDSKQIFQPGTSLLHPHNGVLQIWIEFGLIGALLSCAGIIALCRIMMALPDRLTRRVALSSFLAAMGVGMVGYGLWQGWWIGLLLYILALVLVTVRTHLALHEKPPV